MIIRRRKDMKKFLAGKKDNKGFSLVECGYSYYGNYRGGVGSAGDEVGWKVGEEYG